MTEAVRDPFGDALDGNRFGHEDHMQHDDVPGAACVPQQVDLRRHSVVATTSTDALRKDTRTCGLSVTDSAPYPR